MFATDMKQRSVLKSIEDVCEALNVTESVLYYNEAKISKGLLNFIR